MLIGELKSQIISNKFKLILLATPLIVGTGICLYYYYNDCNKKKKTDHKSNRIKEPLKNQLTQALNLKEKGNEFFRQKKYADAIQKYSEAIQLCPPDRKKELSTFYQNRAACYEHLKQFDNVINDSTKAIEYNRQYIKAYLRRGKAYEMLENYDQGTTNYFIASSITQFEVSEYMDLMSNCLNNYANKLAKDIVSKRKIFLLQKYVFKQNALKLIRDPLRIGLKETLDNYETIFNKLFNEAISDDDLNNLTDYELLFKGTIEIQTGRFEQGIKTLTKLIETGNAEYKINALLKLVDYYFQEMDKTKAEEYINKALEIDPNNPDIYYVRSQLHSINQSFIESKNDLNKAIELEPGFAAAIAQNLLITIQTGNIFESAHQVKLNEFEKYIEEFPDSYELLVVYFQVMINEGELVKAENAINKGLKNDPDNPIFYVYKGLIQFQNEKLNDSQISLEKALEMDPNCTLAYEMLAEIRSKIEDLAGAIDYLEKAIFKSTLYGDIKNVIIKQKYLKMQLETKKI